MLAFWHHAKVQMSTSELVDCGVLNWSISILFSFPSLCFSCFSSGYPNHFSTSPNHRAKRHGRNAGRYVPSNSDLDYPLEAQSLTAPVLENFSALPGVSRKIHGLRKRNISRATSMKFTSNHIVFLIVKLYMYICIDVHLCIYIYIYIHVYIYIHNQL